MSPFRAHILIPNNDRNRCCLVCIQYECYLGVHRLAEELVDSVGIWLGDRFQRTLNGSYQIRRHCPSMTSGGLRGFIYFQGGRELADRTVWGGFGGRSIGRSPEHSRLASGFGV